ELLRTLLDEREKAPPLGDRRKFGDKKGSEASPSPAPVTPLAGYSTPQHPSPVTPNLRAWRRRSVLKRSGVVACLAALSGLAWAGWSRFGPEILDFLVKVRVNPDASGKTTPAGPPRKAEAPARKFKNTLGMTMIRLEAREFQMGSTTDQI